MSINDSLAGSNLAYVESLYEQYLADPGSVDASWQGVFAEWSRESGAASVSPTFRPGSIFHGGGVRSGGALSGPVRAGTTGSNGVDVPALTAEAVAQAQRQQRVDLMVRNYRVRGHIAAHLDPLSDRCEVPEELQPGYYGFTERDMDRPFLLTDGSASGGGRMVPLRDILHHLRSTYSTHVAAQFMHIDNLQVREWLQSRMEATQNAMRLDRQQQIRILTRLTDATIFEEFIQKKFIGAKSFSLEGGETLIPLLDLAFEHAGVENVQEIVIGMAHRGRLNVLANILGKSPAKIFREFEDIDPQLYAGGGDVKYHLGHSGDWLTRAGKKIHLSLCFNPSHLEFVNTVALGRMRAKQDRSGLHSRGTRGFVCLIHGDAAFAGEGIVQETLNLSQLEGYATGGTLHVIINNQIGFTTNPREARSGRYCTDIAKMLQIPIFHVNGERPEAVAQVVQLAMDFRQEFKRDVVIDMYCFRRRGHNEGDEPSYTQPQMYEKINARRPVRESYLASMLELGEITREDADRIAQRRTELLERDLATARSEEFKAPADGPKGLWSGYTGGLERDADDPDTGVHRDTLVALIEKQTQFPETFHLHPKLRKQLRTKEEMATGERPVDWAVGESLAFATLAVERHRIRLSGQDVQRGTFSHRHAVLHDVNTGESYTPLQHLSAEQASVEFYNSPLSEAGVLGFEYGYSLDYPCGLIMWEAQFGDFVNCAQPIIDQFISSAEDKWNRLSGLTMMLPHGFEGQGPEHSSARLERFLNQCAEDNIIVAQPSTPAQHYHLLRRQVVRKWRKPLVILTPKSLLRHPLCVSALEEFTHGRFKRVIADPLIEPSKVERVLLCSGKVYYELLERREKLQRDDVAIVRLEQFYPFPVDELAVALEPYGEDKPVIWVQDEPRNMGAWHFLKGGFGYRLLNRWPMYRVARRPSASPATGSKAAHSIEQEEIISRSFSDRVMQRISEHLHANA